MAFLRNQIIVCDFWFSWIGFVIPFLFWPCGCFVVTFLVSFVSIIQLVDSSVRPPSFRLDKSNDINPSQNRCIIYYLRFFFFLLLLLIFFFWIMVCLFVSSLDYFECPRVRLEFLVWPSRWFHRCADIIVVILLVSFNLPMQLLIGRAVQDRISGKLDRCSNSCKLLTGGNSEVSC